MTTIIKFARETAFGEHDDVPSIRRKLNVEFTNVERLVSELNRVLNQVVTPTTTPGQVTVINGGGSASSASVAAGFGTVYGPVIDSAVPTTGRDFPLPAEFDDPDAYMLLGHAVANGYDVGFVDVKGVNTVNVRPNGPDTARIEFIVIKRNGETS